MKLIINNTLKTITIGALVVLGACTDLDEKVYDTYVASNFPNSDEEIGAAASAPYSNLYGVMNHGNYFSMQEVSSDEVVIPQRGGDWFDGGTWLRVHQHEYNSREEVFNNVWNSAFEAINAVNRIINSFLDESGEISEGNEALVAELSVLRAYYYFWLLDAFGRVPIVSSVGQENIVQNDRTEVLQFVIDEIESNADLLSKDIVPTYGRVNFYAAHALRAKVYLNKAVYEAPVGTRNFNFTQEDMDAVIASCNIVTEGGYTIEGVGYSSVFNANNALNPEHIWVIPYDQVFANGFNLAQMTLHYQSQATFNLQQQPWNGYATLEEFYNSYSSTDSRKANNFLAGPQTDAQGNPLLDDAAEDNDPDGAQINFTPTINELAPNALRQAGARIFKYNFEQGATPELNNDFPIFRYGDIILMKAEAIWRGGNDPEGETALELVNRIRARAGVDDFTTLNEDNLLAERGREMFAETWRRNDLIRFGKYNDPWWAKPADQSGHVNVFPIPDPQINATDNLTQNDGYN